MASIVVILVNGGGSSRDMVCYSCWAASRGMGSRSREATCEPARPAAEARSVVGRFGLKRSEAKLGYEPLQKFLKFLYTKLLVLLSPCPRVPKPRRHGGRSAATDPKASSLVLSPLPPPEATPVAWPVMAAAGLSLSRGGCVFPWRRRHTELRGTGGVERRVPAASVTPGLEQARYRGRGAPVAAAQIADLTVPRWASTGRRIW